jgi:hypothetical protein
MNTNTPTANSAQDHANTMAARGRLRHSRNTNGLREGIGYSSRSAHEAVTSSCYYGQLTPADVGVAKGSAGWYACIRYANDAPSAGYGSHQMTCDATTGTCTTCDPPGW